MRGGDRTALGLWGEEQAAHFLERAGYRILDRRFRCREGELDLVASQGCYLCFVEVKLRGAGAIGLPREFVDGRKRDRLRKAAMAYLLETGLDDVRARFDVAEVYVGKNGSLRVEYLEDAFT